MVMEERDFEALLRIVPLYFLQSFFFGVWFSAIPVIEVNRGISVSILGDYLSIASIGALLGMPLAPYLVDSLGSRNTDVIGFFSVGMALILLSITVVSDVVFGLAMVMYGFSIILIFSATFSQAAVLEKCTHQLWMGIFSASAGAGGMFGALCGGYGLEYTTMEVWEVMSLLLTSMFVVLLVLYPYLYSYEEERRAMRLDVERRQQAGGGLFEKLLCAWAESWEYGCTGEADFLNPDGIRANNDAETEPILFSSPIATSLDNFPNPSLPTQEEITVTRTASEQDHLTAERDWVSMCFLCLIAGLSFFVEGSIGDWGGIYTEDRWKCGTFIGVLGYIVEKAATVAGGMASDYLSTHVISRYWLLQISIVITTVGFFLAAIAKEFPINSFSLTMVITGFGIAGAGLGLLIPTWYSISGRGIRGFSVSETGAIVMTFANVCWLIEPLGMGNLAQATGSLAYAYHFEAALVIFTIIPAWFLPRQYYERPRRRSEHVQHSD
jgi:MFS family permease